MEPSAGYNYSHGGEEIDLLYSTEFSRNWHYAWMNFQKLLKLVKYLSILLRFERSHDRPARTTRNCAIVGRTGWALARIWRTSSKLCRRCEARLSPECFTLEKGARN
jgi:hypothetical protein